MRRRVPFLVVLGVMGVLAMDPALLMRTHTDPSRMRSWSGSVPFEPFVLAWLDGGETAWTAIGWIRWRTAGDEGMYERTFESFWSVE